MMLTQSPVTSFRTAWLMIYCIAHFFSFFFGLLLPQKQGYPVGGRSELPHLRQQQVEHLPLVSHLKPQWFYIFHWHSIRNILVSYNLKHRAGSSFSWNPRLQPGHSCKNSCWVMFWSDLLGFWFLLFLTYYQTTHLMLLVCPLCIVCCKVFPEFIEDCSLICLARPLLCHVFKLWLPMRDKPVTFKWYCYLE